MTFQLRTYSNSGIHGMYSSYSALGSRILRIIQNSDVMPGYKEVQVRNSRVSEFCIRASGFYPSLARWASKNSWKSYLEELFWASENDSGLVQPGYSLPEGQVIHFYTFFLTTKDGGCPKAKKTKFLLKWITTSFR